MPAGSLFKWKCHLSLFGSCFLMTFPSRSLNCMLAPVQYQFSFGEIFDQGGSNAKSFVKNLLNFTATLSFIHLAIFFISLVLAYHLVLRTVCRSLHSFVSARVPPLPVCLWVTTCISWSWLESVIVLWREKFRTSFG